MDTIICHANRTYKTADERNHISWATQTMMRDYVQSHYNRDTCELLEDPADCETAEGKCLIMFVTGNTTAHADRLIESAQTVIAVLEDPNWPCMFNPGRPWHLVTWSAVIADLGRKPFYEFNESLDSYIRSLVPNWDVGKQLASVHGVSLIDLLLGSEYDRKVMSMLDGIKPGHPARRIAYAGSLKHERADALALIASSFGALYGNIDYDAIRALSKLDGNMPDKETAEARGVCKGRIPTISVITALNQFSIIAYIQDSTIEDLGMDTLRRLETLAAAFNPEPNTFGMERKIMAINSDPEFINDFNKTIENMSDAERPASFKAHYRFASEWLAKRALREEGFSTMLSALHEACDTF